MEIRSAALSKGRPPDRNGGRWGSPGLGATALGHSKALCAHISSPRDCGPREVTGLSHLPLRSSSVWPPHRMAPWAPLGCPESAAGAPGRGTWSSSPAVAPVPPARSHGGSRLQGCASAPTIPQTMLFTQFRLSCTFHPPPPLPPLGPLSPGQHFTPALGSGRKPHGELQCPPLSPAGSYSIHLQSPPRAEHPPPTSTKS